MAAPQESTCTWHEFDKALKHFELFLKDATTNGEPQGDWRVIFSMGTVARFKLTDKEFVGYEAGVDWPVHRLAPGVNLETIVDDNTSVWDSQKVIAGDVGTAIRIGYEKLISDGYAYPGGEGSDRIAIQCDDDTQDNALSSDQRSAIPFWVTMWPHRSPCLSNLVLAEYRAEAVSLAGEFRRLDFMFPRVLAVIAPDLTVTRV